MANITWIQLNSLTIPIVSSRFASPQPGLIILINHMWNRKVRIKSCPVLWIIPFPRTSSKIVSFFSFWSLLLTLSFARQANTRGPPRPALVRDSFPVSYASVVGNHLHNALSVCNYSTLQSSLSLDWDFPFNWDCGSLSVVCCSLVLTISSSLLKSTFISESSLSSFVSSGLLGLDWMWFTSTRTTEVLLRRPGSDYKYARQSQRTLAPIIFACTCNLLNQNSLSGS